jgi:hypothetical protein
MNKITEPNRMVAEGISMSWCGQIVAVSFVCFKCLCRLVHTQQQVDVCGNLGSEQKRASPVYLVNAFSESW